MPISIFPMTIEGIYQDRAMRLGAIFYNQQSPTEREVADWIMFGHIHCCSF